MMQLANIKLSKREFTAVLYKTEEAELAGNLLNALTGIIGNTAIALNVDNIELHENVQNGEVAKELTKLLDEYKTKKS